MDIHEFITVQNATSQLWQMILAASEKVYDDKLKSKEGKAELFDVYQRELDRVATEAFNKGREYEANRK